MNFSRRALPAAFALIFLFTTACSGKKTPAPTATSPAPATTPTLIKAPAAPRSLLQLYQANVQDGTWSEGQGLVNLLSLYTSSASADSVLGSTEVDDFELTGLMGIVSQYLAKNPTGALHDTLQKQVNLLEAPLDRLKQFSVKGSLTFDLPGSPATGISPASFQLPAPQFAPHGTQAECQSLWADGFTSTTPVTCFKYADEVVDGTSLSLFYPDWWPTGDSRLSRLEAFLQAASHAISTFNTYGPNPLPPVSMVLTELPATDPNTHRRNADLLAMAIPVAASPVDCYVGIFPAIFTVTVEQSQQALAHELFHCYQFRNLFAQVTGPARSAEGAANDWWVEGSAEYFSNVAYPAINYEHRWLAPLTTAMTEENLFSWGYKAFIFFQYLENRPDTGVLGILNLLQTMPTASGSGVPAQMAALAAWPSMADIFHNFAEAVADQKIMDSDHTLIPLNVPFAPDDISEVTPGNILGREPFSVDIQRVVFPQDYNYDLITTVAGSAGMVTARNEAGPLAWGPPPITISAGCIEVHYIVVETQTGATPDNSYEVHLQADSHPSTGTCSCLTGSWQLDNTSYLTHLNGIIAQAAPGTVDYTDVQGSDIVEFTPDGQVNQAITDLNITSDLTVPNMATQEMVTGMNGNTSFAFTELNGTLSFSSLTTSLAITVLLNGQPLSGVAPGDYFADGPLGSGGAYTCEGDNLTLTPVYPHYTDLPALSFTRVTP